MFSGIVDRKGKVTAADPTAGGVCLALSAGDYWQDVATGASIAIDGVCLTITGVDGDTATFDIIAETLRRSTLGGLRVGSMVNLQKSLRAGDTIDGHFVQGHIDAVAEICRVEESPQESKWWFSLPPDVMEYIIPKGSVTIDGISLTIADREEEAFSVALIPTTLERTTIGQKKVGDRVNIETDILARTIVQHLRNITGGSAAGTSDLRQRARIT